MVTREDRATGPRLQRLDPTTRFVEPIDWPASLAELRTQMTDKPQPSPEGGEMIVRTIAGPLLESVPALLVPATVMVFAPSLGSARGSTPTPVLLTPHMSFTLLMLDRDYMSSDMLPALAQQYFRDKVEDFDWHLAVAAPHARRPLSLNAALGACPTKADASVELFQIRSQEFGRWPLRSEVHGAGRDRVLRNGGAGCEWRVQNS